MKKFLSILLAVMLITALTACGTKNDETTSDTASDSTTAALDQNITAKEATGSFSMTSEDGTFSNSGKIYTISSAGTYTATANIQGGDVGSDAEIYLYVIINGEEITSDPVKLAGWVNWQTPAIKDIELKADDDIIVGMAVKCAGNGWGTMDDFELFKQ